MARSSRVALQLKRRCSSPRPGIRGTVRPALRRLRVTRDWSQPGMGQRPSPQMLNAKISALLVRGRRSLKSSIWPWKWSRARGPGRWRCVPRCWCQSPGSLGDRLRRSCVANPLSMSDLHPVQVQVCPVAAEAGCRVVPSPACTRARHPCSATPRHRFACSRTARPRCCAPGHRCRAAVAIVPWRQTENSVSLSPALGLVRRP